LSPFSRLPLHRISLPRSPRCITVRLLIKNSTTNDGLGVFPEVSGTPFEPVCHGSIAFADVDNDDDMDVMLTGKGQQNILGYERISKLYLNDGNGSFSEDATNNFVPVSYSSILFTDVNDNESPDLLLFGYNGTEKVAKLYRNDGEGSFSADADIPFNGYSHGQVVAADFTNNNKTEKDVFISGIAHVDGAARGIAKLYMNNGKGVFSENTHYSFPGLEYSSVAFADVDNDRDIDLIVAGRDTATYEEVTKLFLNIDGTGDFEECQNNSFAGVMDGTVNFCDFDRDNDQDILITGSNDDGRNALLYLNDGQGRYKQVSTGMFSNFRTPSIDFADVNNDLSPDMILSGSDSTELYTNDGTGNYSLVENTAFAGTTNGASAFGDIDNDGDNDLIVTGSTHAALYINDGSGNFTFRNSAFQSAINSTLDLFDVDNDDDLDVMITGPSSNLYINDGYGIFTALQDMPFENAEYGDVAVADINGNGFVDILISGSALVGLSSAIFTELYINYGNYDFSSGSSGFLPVMSGSVDFADITGNGAPDLLVTGASSAGLYLNDGDGSFTSVVDPFPGFSKSSAAFADVDSDGDFDVIIAGNTGSGTTTILFVNDGAGNFSEYPDMPFVGVSDGCIKFADIDLDGDEDVIVAGRFGGKYIAQLYRNTTCLTTYDTISVFACDAYTVPSEDETYYSSGIFNDTIANYAGCDSVITIHVTIGALDTSVLQTGSTLTANATDVLYQWLDCSNDLEDITDANNQSFTPLTSGSYAVAVSQSSCVDTSDCLDVVIAGTNEVNSPSNISVFPNPAKNHVEVSGENIIRIQLINMDGKVLKEEKPESEPAIIKVAFLNSGFYYLKVITTNHAFVKKLLIE
jgi:hypothetical protein